MHKFGFWRCRVTVIGLAGLAIAGVTGCATGTRTDPTPRVLSLAPDVRAYLLDPTTGLEDIPGGDRSGARQVYDQIRSGDLAAARQDLDALGGVGSAVERVLRAQLAFIDSRPDEARRLLGPEPVGDAGRLLSARLHDLAGDPVAAVTEYWPLREKLEVAGDRVSALLPQAVAERDLHFDRALEGQSYAEAGTALDDLRTWAPDRERTRRSAVRLANAMGDRQAELSAWRSLARVAPPSRQEMFQWAELELTDGNTDQALEISRALVSSADDPRAQELLTRAEFTWRFRLLPEQARKVLKSPMMTRAELAVALYWLFPQARYAPSEAVRIASDILESPHREEIAQVVNAGLLNVDAVGHRFRPELAAMRSDAARGVAILLQTGGAVCAADGAAADSCSVLAVCGVVPVEGCRASEEISGVEFADWARRAQERLTRP